MSTPTVGDFRAEIARQQRTRYELAAQVGIHPARYGRMLNGRKPMPAWVHENTCAALRFLCQGSNRGRLTRACRSLPVGSRGQVGRS
jgi:hypothetical protein